MDSPIMTSSTALGIRSKQTGVVWYQVGTGPAVVPMLPIHGESTSSVPRVAMKRRVGTSARQPRVPPPLPPKLTVIPSRKYRPLSVEYGTGGGHVAANARFRARNLAEGKCIHCSEPPCSQSKRLCLKHLEAQRIYVQRAYWKRKRNAPTSSCSIVATDNPSTTQEDLPVPSETA